MQLHLDILRGDDLAPRLVMATSKRGTRITAQSIKLLNKTLAILRTEFSSICLTHFKGHFQLLDFDGTTGQYSNETQFLGNKTSKLRCLVKYLKDFGK